MGFGVYVQAARVEEAAVGMHRRGVATRVGHFGVIVVASRAICDVEDDCASGAGPWHLSDVAADASSERARSSSLERVGATG